MAMAKPTLPIRLALGPGEPVEVGTLTLDPHGDGELTLTETSLAAALRAAANALAPAQQRTLLVQPGDVLVISNLAGGSSMTDQELHSIREKIRERTGAAHVVIFEDDVQLTTLRRDELDTKVMPTDGETFEEYQARTGTPSPPPTPHAPDA
ncbi:hypothetical protein [Actinocorallia longicatena]|uniref:Uncharacterized protein n=1 Tax=Actinocorallia longicatena TaxID=111803 RepID=A0ABP6QE02_9ACTN